MERYYKPSKHPGTAQKIFISLFESYYKLERLFNERKGNGTVLHEASVFPGGSNWTMVKGGQEQVEASPKFDHLSC